MRTGLFFGIFLLLLPQKAWPWAEHHLITRASLSAVESLNTRTVQVTPLSDLLEDFGHDSERSFNEELKIRKDYRFEFQLDEKAGRNLPLIDVLAKYSDEPDWGMDIELFDEDQYPEIWKSEYSMMGGRKGTPSQAFRHMYWPVTAKHPIKSFHLPFGRITQPMGEAPERARLFIGFSKLARAYGHEYWSARFLGNALHYLEDVASLFHSTQTPTKKFMFMPFYNNEFGTGLTDYVLQVLNIVSYYHFAFEDYIGWIMLFGDSPEGSAESELLFSALTGSTRTFKDLQYRPNDPGAIVQKMALRSLKKSAPAARAAVKFFPAIDVPYSSMNPKEEMNEAWWEETIANGKTSSKPKRKYFKLVREIFEPLGHAVREMSSELD